MLSKTLNEWLAFIEGQHTQAIDLGLERVRAVAQALSLTDLSVPVITVAGTNGKGSTIAYMSAILQQAGYRFGAYTSPHFLHYNERVQLNGQPVDDEALCQAFSDIHAACQALDISLSYFEYGTLAALAVFKQRSTQQQLDMVLLEVGLGGRLDAVNIVDPTIAVVTTVALDHQSWLGDDREQIGFEKAGIYRAQTPAVYGEPDMPASVGEQINSLSATKYQLGDEFTIKLPADGDYWDWSGRDINGREQRLTAIPKPQLPLQNAATAIQALWLLNLPIEAESYRQGIARASLTGRFQQLHYQGHKLLLDVAHNPHAAANLACRLQDDGVSTVRCVIGMLSDKDVASTVAPLASQVVDWYAGSLEVERGLLAHELNQRAPSLSMKEFNSITGALNQALQDSASDDCILVMGSFYTVAEALTLCKGDSLEQPN